MAKFGVSKNVIFWIVLSVVCVAAICGTVVPLSLRSHASVRPATPKTPAAMPVVEGVTSGGTATMPAVEKDVPQILITATRIEASGYYWATDCEVDIALIVEINKQLEPQGFGIAPNAIDGTWFIGTTASNFPLPLATAFVAEFVTPEITYGGKIYTLLLVEKL